VRAILGLAPEQQRALVARRQHRLTSCLELYRERATQHHRERRHREAGVVDGARVILATMTNVYISALLQPQRFDVVIVEEASMAILPTLFYCASLSRNRLIMVGDPRQLPPSCNRRNRMCIAPWGGASSKSPFPTPTTATS
jgi:hypothetical protein